MTHKDIIKQVKIYEQAYKNASLSYNRHNPTKEKEIILDKARKERESVLSALFDFEVIYKSNYTNKDINEYINEKFDIGQVDNEYVLTFTASSTLSKEEKEKLVRYIDKKRQKYSKEEQGSSEDYDDMRIQPIINRVYDSFEKIKQRKNTIYFYVGTSKQEAIRQENLVTKEEIEYRTLISAINAALQAREKSVVVNNDTILQSFNSAQIIPEERKQYVDNDAIELYNNSFDSYKETFSTVYVMVRPSIVKLHNVLKEHLNNN